MTLNFVEKIMTIGGTGNEVPTLQFYKKGFVIGGGKVTPDWRDIILSGNTALTLVNSKANGLNWLRLGGATEQVPQEYIDGLTLEGKCEQNGTPTPDSPVDIVCNNGVVKYGAGKNLFDITALAGSTTVSYSGDTITISGGTNVFVGKTLKQLCPEIEAGKTYCLSMSDSSTTTNKYIWLQNGSPGGQWSNNTAKTLSQADLDNVIKMYCSAVGQTIVQMQIEEGSEATPYEPYHFGLHTDGTQETVEITGKNLFDKSSMYIKGYLENNGAIVSGNGYTITMPCEPNTTYTFSRQQSSQRYRCGCSPNTRVTVGSTGITSISSQSVDANVVLDTVTTTSDAKTLVIWFTNTGKDEELQSQLNQIQIQKGSTATDYEPYYYGGTATAEMLLKVGDYKDTQEVLGGNVTRNVGIKVLNGTENWAWSPGFSCLYVSNAVTSWDVVASSVPISNCYVGVSDASLQNNECRFNPTNFYIRDDRYTSSDVSVFQQYLADQYANGTPIIIAYPLATPTTETVTPQPLDIPENYVLTVTGSLDDLVATVDKSIHTSPTPTQPLDIRCNNGVLKVSPNLFDGIVYSGAISADISYILSTTTISSPYTTINNYQGLGIVMKVEKGKTYVISHNITGYAYKAISFYNSFSEVTNKQKSVSHRVIDANGVFTVGDNDAEWAVITYTALANRTISWSQIQIEEGSTATPYMPYGQIYADGTTETVEVTGKNLMDGENEFGNLDNTGQPSGTSHNYIRTKNFTTIEPNKTYTIKVNNRNNASQSYVLFYDENKNLLSRTKAVAMIQSFYYFTTPANAKYIKAFIYNGTAWEDLFDWQIQLEYGNTATDYEPYFNGGTATAEMLLKVGDYKDTQEVTSGNVTRNVGIKVFDGSEQWSYYSVQQGNMFRTPIADSVSNGKDALGVLCNCYTVIGTGQRTNNTLSGTSKNYDFINNNYTNLTDWTAYVAQQYNTGQPIIIAYPLEEPTTESVTPQPLSIQAGTNIITAEGSIDNLPLEVSYKAGVAVTITEVQNAQLDNNVEVIING